MLWDALRDGRIMTWAIPLPRVCFTTTRIRSFLGCYKGNVAERSVDLQYLRHPSLYKVLVFHWRSWLRECAQQLAAPSYLCKWASRLCKLPR